MPASYDEAVGFISKLEWEGGLDGLVDYGGVSVFPKDVQKDVEAFIQAKEALEQAIKTWLEPSGVEYY